MNCSECTDEQLDYMLWGLSNEGNVGTLDHLASEGFDFRKHMVEFDCKDGGNIGGGIDISVDAQCTVDGLFAAGDETEISVPIWEEQPLMVISQGSAQPAAVVGRH